MGNQICHDLECVKKRVCVADGIPRRYILLTAVMISTTLAFSLSVYYICFALQPCCADITAKSGVSRWKSSGEGPIRVLCEMPASKVYFSTLISQEELGFTTCIKFVEQSSLNWLGYKRATTELSDFLLPSTTEKNSFAYINFFLRSTEKKRPAFFALVSMWGGRPYESTLLVLPISMFKANTKESGSVGHDKGKSHRK